MDGLKGFPEAIEAIFPQTTVQTCVAHVPGTLRPVDDEFQIEASALADHRELGMTWSPIGILRAPSALLVSGRLVREAAR